MFTRSLFTPTLFATAMLLAASSFAQSPAALPGPSRISMQAPGQNLPPDFTVDAKMRAQIIGNLTKKMRAFYVFPEVGEKMAAAIEAHDKAGAYKQLSSANQLAAKLTDDLRAISHDKHIRVMNSPDKVEEDLTAEQRANYKPGAEELARNAEFERSRNYGVEKYERLPGNIAYLELGGFLNAQTSGEVVAAAMTVASSANALIIDLRRNGGGDPDMVALICSYLFDTEPVHLNDLYFREGNSTRQFWTHAVVPGKRFGKDKPVYVLTSERTFSAAEEFSYNLKNLKRATLIGATTGGGANPGDGYKLAEHLNVFIPNGRAISPITKTNWEGTGVTPHIAVPSDQALLTAQLLAMKPVLDNIKEDWRKQPLQRAMDEVQSKLDALKAKVKS
jgi:C-terminal processing protease CtpA/Prc